MRPSPRPMRPTTPPMPPPTTSLKVTSPGSGPYSGACAAVARIAADHPGDLGIVASLLLRHAVLEPGQAIFLPAGGLHAYLHGTGIELLANSDNVVRAGLTSKHIDVPELLKLTDPAVAVPLITPRDLGNGISVYDSPAPEFRLYRASVDASEVVLPGDGPRLVLCVDGQALPARCSRGDAQGRTRRIMLPVRRGPAGHGAGSSRGLRRGRRHRLGLRSLAADRLPLAVGPHARPSVRTGDARQPYVAVSPPIGGELHTYLVGRA